MPSLFVLQCPCLPEQKSRFYLYLRVPTMNLKKSLQAYPPKLLLLLGTSYSHRSLKFRISSVQKSQPWQEKPGAQVPLPVYPWLGPQSVS